MDVQPGQIYFDMGGIPFGRVDEFGVDWAIDAEGFDGWGATSSTRRAQQRTRASGGWSGKGFSAPRALSIVGRTYAPTPELARDALDRLNAAVSVDDTLLRVYEPGLTRYVMVHRTDDVIPKWMMPTDLSWGFGVESDDWRKFGDELSGTTLLPSTTGGLSIPFTVPFTIAATTVSGQVSLNNPGNEVGPVRLRIDGPCTGPVVTHVSSGLQLVFSSSLVLGVGEWLDVDMEAHTVLANGQASRAGWVTRRGWSSFDVGDNTWSFTAAVFDPGSQLTVFATPAWQ
jgi:hypothetical protein